MRISDWSSDVCSAGRTEQAEDLALAYLEAHAVGGGEVDETLGEVTARDRDVGVKVHRRHAFGQRRSASRSAAQQVDDSVLETRRHRGQAGADAVGQASDFIGFGTVAQHQAYAGALDH